MSHTCHAPGCTTRVPPKLFACKTHWFSLPKPIRDAIWREYRVGQEVDKSPSIRYLAVQQLACGKLAKDPADAVMLLTRANEFRKLAIDAGYGDPLEGIVPKMPSKKKARR